MTTIALIHRVRIEVGAWIHYPRVELAHRLLDAGLFLGDLASRVCDEVRPLREDRLCVNDFPEVASAFGDGRFSSFFDALDEERFHEVARVPRPLVEALLMLAHGHPWRMEEHTLVG